MNEEKVEYANWWSKALFGKAFDKQFVIPVPPSRIEGLLMRFIERTKFRGDYSPIKIDRPIFIVGLPRSGTSLLYNLLCAHEKAAYVTTSINVYPDAICTIEWLRKLLNLNIRGGRFLMDSVDVDFSSPSEPAMFWGKWIGRDVDALYWPEKHKSDFSEKKLSEIYTDVRKIIWCFGHGEPRRFICKYPVIQTELRMIQEIFPDAHFIHIVRDGRDVANSLVKLYKLVNDQIQKIDHPWLKFLVPYPRTRNLKTWIDQYGADNLECTARVWQEAIELVEGTKKDLHHFTEVKYEDLVARPREVLGDLFNFCGMNWPSSDNQIFAREFATVGKLRHKNDYKDFDLIEKIAGPTLRKLGYL
jgi:omega-hydroxy-beta-dihydromenaquinone-9 sulfotransferase